LRYLARGSDNRREELVTVALLQGALYACPVCRTWRPYKGFVARDGIGTHIAVEHPYTPIGRDVLLVRKSLGVEDARRSTLVTRKALPVAVLLIAAAWGALFVTMLT
jgi:hypothetical protein